MNHPSLHYVWINFFDKSIEFEYPEIFILPSGKFKENTGMFNFMNDVSRSGVLDNEIIV